MYQKSVGKQIWRVISPIVVYNAAVFVVELIAMSICYIQHWDEILALSGTQDEVFYAALEIIANSDLLSYSVEMMGIAGAIACPFLARMRKKDRINELKAGILPNNKAPLSKYGLIVALSIPFALGLNNIILLANLAEYSEIYQEAVETFYAADFLVQILCLGIISPVVEEYIFRGLIYSRIRSVSRSPVAAMLISGFMFGFYHGNLVQTIYGCLSGVLLAYLYEKYGSMKAPILAHILMNMVALVLTEVEVFVWMFKDLMRMGMITVACAALASSMFLLIKKIDEKPLKCEAE